MMMILEGFELLFRLCPQNAEDLFHESDFFNCVETLPELKRLKLQKNNWKSESYRFDEIFTESSSQRRVYEAVAKPVVESVLNGYNGTVMAYGQTGTGKTYTIGRLGKEDPSQRGIMVRAMEDILANTSPLRDTVSISYLQIYLESIHDLLAPAKINIPISEDPKSGELSLPGAAVFQIMDIQHFLELLHIGEANRHAASTNLNTESSRSHVFLIVYVQQSSREQHENDSSLLAVTAACDKSSSKLPTVLKSKLLVVDLAGSERIDKSGHWKGRSLLIEDGALNWLIANCTSFADSIRHHVELALCHLAQNGDNSFDVIQSGGVKELLRISKESSREDICKLAKKALKSNPAFLKELQQL